MQTLVTSSIRPQLLMGQRRRWWLELLTLNKANMSAEADPGSEERGAGGLNVGQFSGLFVEKSS